MGSEINTVDEAQVRDAASVVLIRDGAAAIETFTLTRSPTMAAFPNATVFPGGAADPSDELPSEAWGSLDLTPWTRAFGDDESTVRRLMVTAVRETFEESGVLLADRLDSRAIDPADYDAARSALENHELSFYEFLSTHRLSVDFSRLRPLARWVTPEGNPRRYNTRFFLAQLPPGQDALRATGEATVARWMSPQVAFELFRRGETQLMPPTWSQFRTLRDFGSASAALAAELEPRLVSPTIEPGDPPRRVSFPHAHEYYGH